MNSEEVRVRQCCPGCQSICIAKYRKLSGKYKCKACDAVFSSPAIREIKSHYAIPGQLRKIIIKKQKEAALAVDKP
jgi:hypothetical protein